MRHIIAFLLIITAGFAYAANPAPTSVTTLTHGSQATISGSDFGAKSTAAPVIWDNMSSGAFNPSWSSVNSLTISTAQHRPKSAYSGHCNMNQEIWCNFEGGTNSAQWFYQYWVYLGSNFSFVADMNSSRGNIKFFRMWDTGSDSGDCVASLHYANEMGLMCELIDENHDWHPTVSGSGCNWVSCLFGRSDPGYVDPSYTGWKNFPTDITTGVWHQFQFEFVENSSIGTADGKIKIWFDGKKIFDRSDVTTRNASNTHYKRPKVVGWYNSHGAGDNPATDVHDFYISDAYLDNYLNRIEVCAGSTWANKGLCEIQPVTSWGSNSVSFTANQGAQATGTYYAYVVKETGEFNANGLAVTWGSGGAGDTTAPVISNVLPSGSQACTSNPRNVTRSWSTDEAATCTIGGVQAATTGSTSHSDTASQACGQSYTPAIVCTDGSGNASGATNMSYSIAAQAAQLIAPWVH